MCIRDRYDIPQSMRSLAWPLIIRQLYLRYPLNLTETRQKAAESADEMLARYARGEMLQMCIRDRV